MRTTALWLMMVLSFIWSVGNALAFTGPGGLAELKLYRGEFVDVADESELYVDYICTGTVDVWNTRTKLQLRVVPNQGPTEDGDMEQWKVKTVNAYVGADPVPVDAAGSPLVDEFAYSVTYGDPSNIHSLVLDLEADLGFRWGQPYEALRRQNICVRAVLVKMDTETGKQLDIKDVWTFDPDFEVQMASDEWEYDEIAIGQGRLQKSHKVKKGTSVSNRVRVMRGLINQTLMDHWGSEVYEMAHPRRAHFIDSPVAGLGFETPTHQGKTDDAGAFDYFPGERADLSLGEVYLGNALIDHKISPVDVFEGGDMDDNRVINQAWLLQSLDADGDPSKGISITESVVDAVETVMNVKGLVDIDFSDDVEVESIIDATISESAAYPDLNLVKVSKEEAEGHLGKSIGGSMFRKNVSKTPDLASAKAKLNVMPVWFPALKANGDPADYTDDFGQVHTGVIPYYDEDGAFIREAAEAKPLVCVYTDEVEGFGAADVFAAVSRDDGNTWKRKNISRMADRSSFTLGSGEEYYGHCKKPVFQVKGNKIMIAWTSKFAKGGKPRYAIKTCDDPETDEVETPETGCAVYCKGSPEDGTQVCEPDYPYDDAYFTDDIWGVSGPQRSVDYTDQGYPEVGEVPYSAVWVARGTIVTQGMKIGSTYWDHYDVGDIVWFKPERLTSARRDANQVFMGAADGAGFAIAWQEDPKGLRPGEAKGPGPGWGGATTNHKTDIWYSHVTWDDILKVDTHFESKGDPEHDNDDFLERPKALMPMALPVRISDNDVVNTDNMWIQLRADGLPELDADGNFIPIVNEDTSSDQDSDGSHRYGYMLDGLWDWDGTIYYQEQTVDWEAGNGGTLYQFTNQQDEPKTVVVTADGRALDGNTGAARPNLFLQTYTNNNGTPDDASDDFKSAWAIMAYEESKGVGLGPDEDTGTGEQPQDGSGYDPNETFPDAGKNAIYHSFDFRTPDLVSCGTVLNLHETDADGTPLNIVQPECLGSQVDENGAYIVDADGNYLCEPNPNAGEELLDWKGDPIPAYENARRPRFILQSKSSAFGGTKPDGSFKEPGNSGTVLIVLYKEGQEGAGRPSDIMARRCVTSAKGNPYSPANFVDGVQNLSTVTPVETWINPDRDENAKGDGTKVCRWEQPVENLALKSGDNPYEDARAHRGAIRGDFVIMGYSYTPNWAASRNAHDKYDFYIRRSFNGGATWTTDPSTTTPVVHTDIFFDPEGISGSELDEEGNDATEATKHYTVETEYAGGGIYEPARNVSLIKNNKISVIEPRIVAVPGTIKKDGAWTDIAEDKQDRNCFYLAYGTSTNLPDVEKAPEDLFLSFSRDQGTIFFEDEWVVNPDSDGNHAGETVTGWIRLAKGDPEQGEVQIRMTPDGSRFYGCWLEEGLEGSDILFRRIMPIEFPNNVGAAETTPEEPE